MLDKLDAVAGKTAVADMPAFDWLMRLRALKNLHVIASSPAAAGGDHDFSEYGVNSRYEAGRAAAKQYLARMVPQPKLKAAA